MPRLWALAPHTGFGVSPGLPVARPARSSARGARALRDGVHGHANSVPMAPSPPTDADSIYLNIHKYLSPLTQAAAPGVHPQPTRLSPIPLAGGSLPQGWGIPHKDAGPSHTTRRVNATAPLEPPAPPRGLLWPLGVAGGCPYQGVARAGAPMICDHPKDPPWLTPFTASGVSARRSGTRQGREGTPPGDPGDTPPTLPCRRPPQHVASLAAGASSRPQPPRSSAAVMFRLEDNVLEIIALIKKG